MYDACALASKFALNKTKFPKLNIKSDDEGQLEIDISDDISDQTDLNVEELPYAVSVCKIGQNFVVDADLKEESVAKVRLTFGFDKNGNIRYASKDGFGSLDPDTLYSIIDVSISQQSVFFFQICKKEGNFEMKEYLFSLNVLIVLF